MDTEGKVAALQTSSMEAFLSNASLVAVLLTEWAVMPWRYRKVTSTVGLCNTGPVGN